MIIFLSPSDQSGNETPNGHSEKDHCTEIAKFAEKYLKEYGHVVYLGDNSKRKTYADRVNKSNELNADLHICIHTNAGGGEGTTVYTQPINVNNQYVNSVYNSVAKCSIGKDRGIHANTTFYEINHCNTVTIYVECEFHDNADLDRWIDTHVEDLGKAIADGIGQSDTFPITNNETVINEDEIVQLYRVQIGAFANRTYARARANEAMEKGFDAYIRIEDDKLYHVQIGCFKNRTYANELAEKLKKCGFKTYIKITYN